MGVLENLIEEAKALGLEIVALGIVSSDGSTTTTSRTYTVQSGDTLSEIAERLGVPMDTLVSVNAISDPNLIYPGEVLRY